MHTTIDSSRGMRPCSISLLRDRHRRAAGGLGEDAFGLGQQVDAGADLVVGDHLGPAAGLLQHLDHLEAVGRVADRDRLGDRVGLHRIRVIDAGVQRLRRPARSRPPGPRRSSASVAVDEADRAQLRGSRAQMRGSSVPPATGRDHVLRQPPAELLDDLEAERLGALGVVGAQVDVGEAPAVLVGDLRAEAVDVVVVAADRHQLRLVDARARATLPGSRSSGMKT